MAAPTTPGAAFAVRIELDFYDTAPWFEQLIGRSDLPCDVDFVRVGYDDTTGAVCRRVADLGVVALAASAPSISDDSSLLAADHLVAVVRSDHAAAFRGELVPEDVENATYITAGDRPTHGFEHHEFFEPAGVRPRQLRKVESLAMVIRLMRSTGGVTVQPAMALRSARLDGLLVVPLAGNQIPVRWELVLRQQAHADELAMAEANPATCQPRL